ncbi:hypothetical protein VIGAN_07175600 [Vigna angularis var. angularis]|uniref:Uncharacterized protein n=1 Tax=Vigna angularis var. angularis TaxID=157739 RepID=A0A0S3SJC6_PHAAN|nr:hypothetical protein VIGAN_07175600 [Vigna angularis var. angularis]
MLFYDGIFDGVPGFKSSFKFSYGDVFVLVTFNDLLGGLGKLKSSEKEERCVADFDPLDLSIRQAGRSP